MGKKIIFIGTVLLVISLSVRAQDYHVAHYDVAGLYLNPALTGMYGNESHDYRAYLDQRSQWRSVGVKPYLTSYLAYDRPFPYKGRNYGIGGYIMNNNGGIGNFNTLSLMLSGSYDILNSNGSGRTVQARPNNKHMLTVGLQMGLFYRSTSPNSLNYDVQYSLANGGTFDQSLPNNEVYNRANITRFDANYGLFYKFLDKQKKYHPYAGLSISHLTRPRESLTGGDSRLPLKWAMQAGSDFKVNDRIDLTPRALYMLQSKASDLTLGMLMYYRINDDDAKVLAAFDYRVKDAAIVSLGYKNETYAIRLSYDVNTSFLKNYTRGRGAFEISLIYTGNKGKLVF